PDARGTLVKPLQSTLTSYESKCKILRDKYREMVGDQVVSQGNSVSMMIHDNLLPQLKTISESVDTLVKNPTSDAAPSKIKTAMKNWSSEKGNLEKGVKVAVESSLKSVAEAVRDDIASCKALAKTVNESALAPFKKLDTMPTFTFDILNKFLAL